MRSDLAGAQVDDAARRIGEPRVTIPLVGRGCVLAIAACQTVDTTNRATRGKFGGEPMGIRFDGGLTADVPHEVSHQQGVVGLPAVAGPHQPLAPLRAVAPVFGIAAGKGQCQRVICGPDRILVVGPGFFLHWWQDTDARPRRQKALDIEILRQSIGHIPSFGFILRWHQHSAGQRAHHEHRIGGGHCVIPSGFVAVGPDQHMLAGQGRPVGFLDRRVCAVHSSGRHDACVDQGLCAFLAFDQHHGIGRGHAHLVVERTWIRRCHLLALGIPRTELLAPPRWVVAINATDQLAFCREVIPLGRGRAQLVDQRFLLVLLGRGNGRSPSQVAGQLHHLREVRLGVDLVMPGNQVKDVAAVTRGAIRPEARLVAIKHNLEAIARTAQHVADEKLAFAHLASRIEREQNTLQPADQICTQCISFGVRILWCAARGIVEIHHADALQQRFAHAQYLHS